MGITGHHIKRAMIGSRGIRQRLPGVTAHNSTYQGMLHSSCLAPRSQKKTLHCMLREGVQQRPCMKMPHTQLQFVGHWGQVMGFSLLVHTRSWVGLRWLLLSFCRVGHQLDKGQQ